MRYIHPFPARMAPEIVLSKLKELDSSKKVLDPMMGSGMVLNVASRLNIKSYGVDIDPLSVLISKVASTKVNEENAKTALDLLINYSKSKKNVYLPWIDENDETLDFINYWFDEKQVIQLRSLAYFLSDTSLISCKNILDVLKVAISRLIITKNPKASLARDTAHSRPHKVIEKNDFDIFDALPASLSSVINSLKSSKIKCNSKVTLGDSRNLNQYKENKFDMIITSPPYLNAIDYMRGHKFSLIWFGYSIPELRNIRSVSIGTNKKGKNFEQDKNDHIFNLTENLHLNSQLNKNYLIDLHNQLSESYRVLKGNGIASFVIGNSIQKNNIIFNNEILKFAAKDIGFKFISEIKRDIPNNKRYMPIAGNSSLSKRMKTEYIITFKKE